MLKDIDAFPLKMKNELHALGQLLFFNPYSAHFEQLEFYYTSAWKNSEFTVQKYRCNNTEKYGVETTNSPTVEIMKLLRHWCIALQMSFKCVKTILWNS